MLGFLTRALVLWHPFWIQIVHNEPILAACDSLLMAHAHYYVLQFALEDFQFGQYKVCYLFAKIRCKHKMAFG
jgi:hypothetical protein